MIVELYVKGTNFKSFINIYHNVKRIENNNFNSLLITDDKECIELENRKFELKVTL